jgi:hypothetical protein
MEPEEQTAVLEKLRQLKMDKFEELIVKRLMREERELEPMQKDLFGNSGSPYASKEDFDKANLFSTVASGNKEGYYKQNGQLVYEKINNTDPEMPSLIKKYKDTNGNDIGEIQYEQGRGMSEIQIIAPNGNELKQTKLPDGFTRDTVIIGNKHYNRTKSSPDYATTHTRVTEYEMAPEPGKPNATTQKSFKEWIDGVGEGSPPDIDKLIEQFRKPSTNKASSTRPVVPKADVIKMETGPAVPKEGTAELTFEAYRAGGASLIPGKDMTLAKVKKQMKIMSPNLEWEQVSPTHIRGRIGNMEYNVIDSNGDIYQTTRTIK